MPKEKKEIKGLMDEYKELHEHLEKGKNKEYIAEDRVLPHPELEVYKNKKGAKEKKQEQVA